MFKPEASLADILGRSPEASVETIADEDIETTLGTKEEKEFTERDQYLEKLWTKYQFVGEAPFKGSPVEKRLYNTCKKYNAFSLDTSKYNALDTGTDDENYFAKPRDFLKILGSSEAARRELHNQIAMMVTGRQRSGMDFDEATEIAHFACEFVYGCDMHEALDLKAAGALVERGL